MQCKNGAFVVYNIVTIYALYLQLAENVLAKLSKGQGEVFVHKYAATLIVRYLCQMVTVPQDLQNHRYFAGVCTK